MIPDLIRANLLQKTNSILAVSNPRIFSRCTKQHRAHAPFQWNAQHGWTVDGQGNPQSTVD